MLLETHQRQRMARQKSLSQASDQKAKDRGSQAQPAPDVATPQASNGTVHQGGHEHYERFSCMLIGSCSVGAGQGMQVLNEAVERLRGEQGVWQEVIVDVAISSITIADSKV